VHTQVVDGGTAYNKEGGCEYIEKADADIRKGWSYILRIGRGANNFSRKNVSCYEIFIQKASDLD